MKIYFCLLLVICLSGCVSANMEQDEFTKYSTQITNKFIHQYCNDEEFQLLGRGSRKNKDIQAVHLTFVTKSNVDMDAARKICVNMEEEYLRLLNTHFEIRQYLFTYPIGIEAFNIAICFTQADTLFADSSYIGKVTHEEGKIYYSIYDHEKRFFKIIHSEPYEEAYKIVYGKERGP